MPIVRTETVEGASKGMVTIRAPHQLGDQEVVWLQDSLVDQAGLVRRRNGIPASGTSERANVVTDATNTRYPQGIATCFTPDGNARFAVLYFDTPAGLTPGLYGAVYDSNLTLIGRQCMVPLAALTVVGAVTGTMHVWTGQLPDGGVLITVGGSQSLGLGPNDATSTAIWYGGGGATVLAGASSAAPGLAISSLTVNRNDTIVTMAAADVAKLTPGCVIGNYTAVGIGVIRRIESATTVSLVSPYVGANLAANVNQKAMVTMNPLIYRSQGLVSCAAGGVVVTGYGTKFKTFMDNAGAIGYTAAIVSQQDGQVIATVTFGATTTDTNPGVCVVLRSASMEPYRIISTGGQPVAYLTIPQTSGSVRAFEDTGISTFVYKGCTFWMNKANYLGANTFPTVKRDTPLSQRCWISGPSGPFDFDHDPAQGAYFDVVSELDGDIDIMCGGATPNVAIICKRKSTYLVTGDDPDTFQIVKLINEGALPGSKVLPYQGGVIWFGPTGIWFYDGSSVPVNLVIDTILPTYKRWAASYNTANFGADAIATDHYAAWFRAFIYNDHLFLCMGGIGGQVPQVYSGHTAGSQNTNTMVMYLPNRAASFWTNFRFIDFLPAEFNSSKVGYVLLEQASSATWTLVSLDSIMLPNYPASVPSLQNDNFQVRGCTNAGLTPSFYMETKRYGLQDPMNRKVWKGLSIEACFSDNSAHVARVNVDYVQGLNAGGTLLATWFPDTGNNLTFKAQRVKARARNQYLGFRIYEDPTKRSVFLSLGAWQMMYKPGRAGAI